MKQSQWLAGFLPPTLSHYYTTHLNSVVISVPKDEYSQNAEEPTTNAALSKSPNSGLSWSRWCNYCRLLQGQVQPSKPMMNAPSRENTYRMAEFRTWKVSLFKASINIPNDIPRHKLQQYWSNLQRQPFSIHNSYRDVSIASNFENQSERAPQIPRGPLVRKGQYSCNQTPVETRCQWRKLLILSLPLTFPRGIVTLWDSYSFLLTHGLIT